MGASSAELAQLYDARDAARKSGNPAAVKAAQEALGAYYDLHPELSVKAMADDSPEKIIGSIIKDNFFNLTGLDQRRFAHEQGEEFSNWVYTKSGETPPVVSKEQLSKWLSALGETPPSTFPPGNATAFKDSTEAQSMAYADRQARKEALGGKRIDQLEEQFFAIPDSDRKGRDAFMVAHPELREWFDFNTAWKRENPDVVSQIPGMTQAKPPTDWERPDIQAAMSVRDNIYDKYSTRYGVDARQVEGDYWDQPIKRTYTDRFPWLKELWDEKRTWDNQYPEAKKLLVEYGEKKRAEQGEPARTPTPAKAPSNTGMDKWHFRNGQWIYVPSMP